MTSKEARELPVVQLSSKVWNDIRKISPDKFPGDWFDQTVRSALSVGSNWCEAIGRDGITRTGPNSGRRSLNVLNYYRVARGSGYELSFQISAAGLTKILKDVDKMCDIMDEEIHSIEASILLDTAST